MKKLFSFLQHAPKRTAALAVLAAAVIIPATVLAWGPSRDTYTIEHPADHVVFNSITNNPAQGDERNFMQVREATASNTTYADSISLSAGKEYVIYMYYHNDAASNLNASGVGKAVGSYAKAQIPAVVANGSANTQAVGYVGATNAQPKEVWDEISFKNATGGDIALRYVAGSTTIHNFGKSDGMTMSDNIVTSGAPLGYDALDGVVPGCNDYAGYVTFRVKADQANFTFSKMVSKHGENKWVESYKAQPGETVDYLLQYKNTGTTLQNDVVLKDTLPTGMTYVDGSTTYGNANTPNGVKASDNITKAGINVGAYNPGGNAWAIFSAKVAENDKLTTCGPNTLHNVGRVETNNGSKEDSADVTVDKTCVKECKPGIPVGDKRCEDTPPTPPTTTTPETPAPLPSTGPASILGGLVGTSSLGLGVHHYLASRRALKNKLG